MEKAYEIGFWLSPLLTPEQATLAVEETFKTPLKQTGGQVLTEAAPKLMPLAYRVRRAIDNKNQSFAEAYFGWLRFKAAPETAVALSAAVRRSDRWLRSLVVNLPAAVFAPVRQRPARPGAPVPVTGMPASLSSVLM